MLTVVGLLVSSIIQRQVRLSLHTHDQQIPGNKGLTAIPTAAAVLTLFAQAALIQINYHPQSGWFEDAPLKGGAVAGSPRRGHWGRRPPQGAAALPGPALGWGCPDFRGAQSPHARGAARGSCSSCGRLACRLPAASQPTGLPP